MATSSAPDDPISRSPKEDFNPLTDYMESVGRDGGSDDEEDYDSLGSSMGYECDLMDMYGVTPPPNQRAKQRFKEKTRGLKLREDKLITRVEKIMYQTGEAYGQDEVIDEVTIKIDNMAVSPPDTSTTSPQIKKKGNPKTIKHLRSQERDYKNISNLPATDPNQLAAPVQSIKIDSPNRYYSLHSKQVVVSSSQEDESPSEESTPRRKHPVTKASDCTKDRLDFYRTFSMLINMGNTARKEKKESKASPQYVRQLSSEQAVWQNKLNDLIWLELQAWRSFRTMEEQDAYLSEAQRQVAGVLDEVAAFTVKLPEYLQEQQEHINRRHSDCRNNIQRATSMDDSNVFPEDSIILEVIDGTPRIQLSPATESAGTSTTEVNLKTGERLEIAVKIQNEALLQVSGVLDRLEEAEVLYPTTKALGKAHPPYASDEFQRRVKTLCLWMNVTKDLAHKLHVLARTLSIEQMEDIYWPWLDLEGVNQLMRDIRDPQDTITPQIDDEGHYSSPSSPTVGSMEVRSGASKSEKSVKFTDTECKSSDTSLVLTPSDTSTPMKSPGHSYRASLHFSHASSSMSLEDLNEHSIYRYYADRMLKKLGLRKMLERLKKIMHRTLCRARQGLVKPASNLPRSYAEVTSNKEPLSNVSLSTSPKDLMAGPSSMSIDLNFSLNHKEADIGVKDFEEMGLPSYKPTYLFLVRTPLDVVHECLRLRLSQKPETEPSLLSVRQLIRECKEVLVGSVKIKQYYQIMVAGIIDDVEKSEYDLEAFEEDMKEMLEVYFNYLQIWMCGLQNLPEMSKRLKNALEEEWKFVKVVCPHIRGGEANASTRFCTMASSLLRSISDFLEREMDECIDKLYDVTASITEEDIDTSMSSTAINNAELRQAIIQACRNFRTTFHEARERASKALGFAKMLRKDLEIAADFNITSPAEDLLAKLEKTDHVRVLAPHSTGYLMFIPAHIADNPIQIMHLLNVTCGREDTSFATSPALDGGYLLLVKCEGCSDMQPTCPEWTGRTVKVEPTAEATIALSHVEVEGLLLVVIHSSHLNRQRKNFEHLMSSSVQMVSENTSCRQSIADSLTELKTAALDLREKVAIAIHCVDEKLNLEDIPEMDEVDKSSLLKLYRETLHQCYNFGFEYHKEVIRLVSGEMRGILARMLIDFVKQWAKFVSEKCERGRGVRPRWASQGLDFLIVACEPRVLALLSDEEFEELKKTIHNVIYHVIGDKTTPGSPSTTFRVGSPDVSIQRQQLYRNQSCPDQLRPSRSLSSVSTRSSLSDPPTPFFHPLAAEPGLIRKSASAEGPRRRVDLRDSEDGGIEIEVLHTEEGKVFKMTSTDENPSVTRMNSINKAVQDLEQERTNELYNKSSIGRVISRQVEVDYHINIRRVNFKWQRGFKIGEGQFGKVYTAINIDNGEMVAMKEIRFQPNDHQTIKDIADEIKRFEGISHPSLVKYYGVEVHRDEMLIFMEYCSEGTLAEVAKLGLPEAMVRKYTCELLVAVNVLHENGIVHRDIKGANIFLHQSGLKLGDFGCSVQLKSHTTQPGEVKNIAGTTAYMAPEVITHNDKEGSGRAADIWSLGCVVIEMATGKRPWHELENNFMIMFKVGMGGLPTIPEHLSEEGKDFLAHCFESDPRSRWTAVVLQNHAFVKIYTEENPDEEVSTA